jgi:hypothetical protein
VDALRDMTSEGPERLPDRLAEHFLAACDWDVGQAHKQVSELPPIPACIRHADGTVKLNLRFTRPPVRRGL